MTTETLDRGCEELCKCVLGGGTGVEVLGGC